MRGNDEAGQRKFDACEASDPRPVKVVYEAEPRDVTGKVRTISQAFAVPAGVLQGMQGDRELSLHFLMRICSTMNTKMMAAGPWACSGNRTTTCGRVATHFLGLPVYNNNPPAAPFIRNLKPIPICGGPECDTGAQQQLREFRKLSAKNLDSEVGGRDLDFLKQDEIVYCRACGKIKAEKTKLRLCGRCKVARYCSKECQSKDWKEGDHKNKCVPFDKK
eukprot:CAMPEP_0198198800 /NCGR_PEP_ID=MMETSP1445-20131203/2180_1 /TAXON_ID=36898 /ORGANISM="Pyramimonas sp., Strain CCMP2087" /LENGTH=218 /DNA_ID=CAMNT_0043868439 /DNA_START=76 /DNA_END=732 /DNA_ORIENTATION=-